MTSSITDKIKGYTNQAVGKAKQALADVTDNPKLRADGKAQEVRGDVQKVVSAAKEDVKGSVDER